MITAQDILNEKTFPHPPGSCLCDYDIVVAAMKEFAKLKCAEQRGLCCRNSTLTINNGKSPAIDVLSILNAPEPTID